MKKLVSILCVTMLTMLATVLAQPVVMPVYSYFIVTNKTTNETKSISTNQFSSNKTYDVDFCFGVYNKDQIEVTYSPALSSAKPKLTWSSSNGILLPETGLTTNLKVEGISSNGQTLTITCDYKDDEISSLTTSYKINFPNAHKGKRIYVTNSDIRTIQIFYEDYYKEDVFSCSGQYPTTALYKLDNGEYVSSGRLNALGMGSLTAKGAGFYVVKVMVNNQVIFTETIRIN